MLDNLQPHNDMIVGTAVQDQFLRSTQKGDLRIPTKSGEIIIPGYVFPENTLDHNLAGLSPLCNAGCTVTLTATAITVDKDGEILFHNSKLPTDALWYLDFTNNRHMSSALQTIRLDSNAEYVSFTHAVFGSIPVSSFLSAVDQGWLGNYPKITGRMIRQNPPITRATAMGYLDQTRQGQRSTRQAHATPLILL